MNVSENDVKVLGKVVSIAVDGIVADAEQVFDKNANLNQETINRNMTNAINQAVADVSSINTRVGSLEDAIDDKLNISDYQTYSTQMRDSIMRKIGEVEDEFYTLELQNATGSVAQATELHIALNKNGGSEEDPEIHGISTLTISQATENKAGLLPAKSKWDDEPITGSSNLVKSGGIKSAMDNMNSEIAEELAKKQEKLVSTSLEITGNSIEIPSVNIPIGTLLEELEGTDEKHPRTVSAERLQYLFNTTTNLQKLMGKRAYGKYDKQGRYYTAPVKVVLGESSGAQLAHVIFYLIDENKEIHVNVSWLPGVLSFSPGTGYMKLNTNIENIFPINSNYRGSDRTTAPGLYLYNAGLDNGHFAPMLEEYTTGLLIVTREHGIYSSTGDSWNNVCQLFIDMYGNMYSRKLPYTDSVEDIDWTNAPDFVLRS